MLKRKINEEVFNGLSDILKAEYVKNGSDYVLDTDEAKELISARDAEKRRADELKTERDALKTERDAMKAANGDWSSLEASYKTKVAGLETQLTETNSTLTAERRDRHVTGAAMEIANKHFTVPKLLLPSIAARLDLDPKDNKTVRVLDATGKPSAATLEDLAKEFVDNKEYAGIVKANQASGSAGRPASGGNGLKTPFTPPTNADGTVKNLATMKPAELVAHRQAQADAAAAAAT